MLSDAFRIRRAMETYSELYFRYGRQIAKLLTLPTASDSGTNHFTQEFKLNLAWVD